MKQVKKDFIRYAVSNPIDFLLQLPPWLYYQTKKKKANTLDYKIPWLTFRAIWYLKRYLKKNMRVFEWGSGGSTLFLQDKVEELVSIEHNEAWYDKVKPETSENTKLYYIDKEDKYYYNIINKYYDEYFDIVIVDGRNRNECIKAAMSKVISGGILILDNSERYIYNKGKVLLSNWRRVHFDGLLPFGGYTRTTVYYKK